MPRHGWREAGGTRRAGSYGQVMHTADCYGGGWKPYEVSKAGTESYIEELEKNQKSLRQLPSNKEIYKGMTAGRQLQEIGRAKIHKRNIQVIHFPTLQSAVEYFNGL